MRINLDMELTELAIVSLSEDDDGYQEKLASVQEAGFWFDPVFDCWTKPEPLLEGRKGSTAVFRIARGFPRPLRYRQF